MELFLMVKTMSKENTVPGVYVRKKTHTKT